MGCYGAQVGLAVCVSVPLLYTSQMELGITGGEEDGVNNEDVNPEDLYSKPEEIWEAHFIL